MKDAITDSYGDKLDGDGDGICGGNWRADFVVIVDAGTDFSSAAHYSDDEGMPFLI